MLNGKNVLITGGSKGLGRSLCKTFAREGANIAFNYMTDEAGAAQTQKEAGAFGTEVLALRASVADKTAVMEMVDRIGTQWSQIDILVNNAGITQMLPMALLEEEDWDAVMDINAKGTYLVSRTVLRGMIRRRCGKILNISSLAGMKAIEAPVHYASSKAAVKGFTEALAKEVARYNITVNAIAPGLLEGGVGDYLPPYRLKEYLRHCSLGRVGKFDEVSDVAAFMVSDLNSYMTGFVLIMDGGL
ncbi:MAG: 3-oxoacyl-ACP reductase FabG [bacterium]|nr:3-oxoacyl-ACP reductase FabG [bacterium]